MLAHVCPELACSVLLPATYRAHSLAVAAVFFLPRHLALVFMLLLVDEDVDSEVFFHRLDFGD